MDKRTQFTFYESFRTAIKRIRKAADRATAYDVICDYALYGTVPDIEKLPDTVALAFELIRPNLDSAREKAKSGKKGGEAKQNGSKTEAKQKQTAREKEIENEYEIEIENENEYNFHSFIHSDKTNDGRCVLGGELGKGLVMLSDEQFNDLLGRLSLDELHKYCEIIADAEANGRHYRKKTHYQAILDMAMKDRAVASERV